MIVGHESPGIVLIREDSSTNSSMGDLFLLRNENGKPAVAVALDHVGFADGRWLRALYLSCSQFPVPLDLEDVLARDILEGEAFSLHDKTIEPAVDKIAINIKRSLLGLVAPDTALGKLQIEVVRIDVNLHQGRLVEVEVGSRRVLYQIIEGITREEILHQKNTHGFVRAVGKKIGCWNEKSTTFDSVQWLPQPNAPVFLTPQQAIVPNREAVGHFPGTNYTVQIDPHLLVTHNAAILGVLGVGKTFLALEIVERLIEANIKVVCLDLTDQYAQQLASFYNNDFEGRCIQELSDIGPSGRDNFKMNVAEGGSVGFFSSMVKEQLAAFLSSTCTEKLKIFNPARFEVWRQDSKLFNNKASMATLTPTEITRIITEAALEVLQTQGMTAQARCCLIYEEAHSLIPEWNAVANEGDKAATNGTAKAILQGRKFGLGCLVITQRTANVTKSILNQCNTVFALRVFDSTGMEFLRNYIGEDYAGVLSTLEDRHAIFFGRASSCNDPVLIQLNDREQFLHLFRAK
ncbi:MAG TPA: DUF87 domain-containing protein [Thermodesulfobacteriota bacterium]|nr:DUF87 domain-containing protein [Deltaproteobacteria bacterium]HNR13180.1 DUF87 domain-containing protein [Thermodesulfobacteriota bacterium]